MTTKIEELRKSLIALITALCAVFVLTPTILTYISLKPVLQHFGTHALLRTHAESFADAIRKFGSDANGRLGPVLINVVEPPQGGSFEERRNLSIVPPWNPGQSSPVVLTTYSIGKLNSVQVGTVDHLQSAIFFRVSAPATGLPFEEYVVLVAQYSCARNVPERFIKVMKWERSQFRPSDRTLYALLCTSLHEQLMFPMGHHIAAALLTAKGVDPSTADLSKITSAIGPDMEDGPVLDVGPIKVRASDAQLAAGLLLTGLSLSLITQAVSFLRLRERPHGVLAILLAVSLLGLICSLVSAIFLIRILRYSIDFWTIALLFSSVGLAGLAGLSSACFPIFAFCRSIPVDFGVDES